MVSCERVGAVRLLTRNARLIIRYPRHLTPFHADRRILFTSFNSYVFRRYRSKRRFHNNLRVRIIRQRNNGSTLQVVISNLTRLARNSRCLRSVIMRVNANFRKENVAANNFRVAIMLLLPFICLNRLYNSNVLRRNDLNLAFSFLLCLAISNFITLYWYRPFREINDRGLYVN